MDQPGVSPGDLKPLQMADRPGKIRFKTSMVQQGIEENEALRQVTPGNSNRASSFKTWKERGLWPVPESELTTHALLFGEPTGDPAHEGMAKLDARVTAIVRPELSRLV